MLADRSRLYKHFVQPVWLFFRELGREFMDKGCQKSAAALTYMTLFALVPLMTVTYSMFSVIPAFNGVADQLQNLIFQHFVPETGVEVKEYLSSFSSQARSLTAAGVVMLVVTAYLMLTNIEKTFNVIWGVKQGRRGLSSFLLYWAVLSIGPLLLGAGLVISTYLLSLKLLMSGLEGLGVSGAFFRLLPVLMTSTAFTLLFAAVPNCRVPIKFAAIGGIVTAICFELLKMGFGYMVANSSFQLIYGAFAVVPLFLLWVNFLWMIILTGAVFVRTLAERGYASASSRLSDLGALLRCLAVFREHAQRGDSVTDQDCVRAGLGLVHWQTLRSTLVAQKWITVTDSGNYVLSRDTGSLTLWDAVALVDVPLAALATESGEAAREWEPFVADLKEQIVRDAKKALDVPLDQLFTQKMTPQEKSLAAN